MNSGILLVVIGTALLLVALFLHGGWSLPLAGGALAAYGLAAYQRWWMQNV